VLQEAGKGGALRFGCGCSIQADQCAHSACTLRTPLTPPPARHHHRLHITPAQTSLDSALSTITGAVQELVRAQRVVVFLMDHAREVLWTSFVHPVTGHVRQIRCGLLGVFFLGVAGAEGFGGDRFLRVW